MIGRNIIILIKGFQISGYNSLKSLDIWITLLSWHKDILINSFGLNFPIFDFRMVEIPSIIVLLITPRIPLHER